MSKTEIHPSSVQKEAFEYFAVAFIGIIFLDVLMLAIGDNIILWGFFFVGIILGLLYSKRKFQQWQSFVAWKIMEDANQVSFVRRILSFVVVVGIVASYRILSMYVGEEIIFGIGDVVFGFYTGSLIWLFWLHLNLNNAS